MLIPALIGCGGANAEVLPGEATRANAKGPCEEFEQAAHSWHEGDARGKEFLGSASNVSRNELVNLAHSLAPEVLDEDLRVALESLSSLGTANRTREVIAACRQLGVDVTDGELTEAQIQALREEREQREPSQVKRVEGDEGPAASGDGESLKRQALEQMWATTSAEERAATCSVYAQSPDALVDGFMSSAGHRYTESMVRAFYDSKCN